VPNKTIPTGVAVHNGRVAFRWDFWRAKPHAKPVDAAMVSHLDEFVASHSGVEVYLEPQTTMTRPSLVLVAFDGEWTRRSIDSWAWGQSFAARHSLPFYDAGVLGYPQRMRDYNARRRTRG
jgi:hypothetical protein